MKVLLFTCCLILLNSLILSQEKEQINAKRYFNEAHRYILFKNYSAALTPLLKISENDADNANVNYLIGLCYLYSDFDKDKAPDYFKKTLKDTIYDYKRGDFNQRKAPTCTYYYLAKAYHLNYKFDEAIKMFEIYRNILIKDDQENPFLKDMDHRIQVCMNAKEIVKKPIEISISNLGKTVNSVYEEHSPVINSDETVLIFTSRREGSTGGDMTADGRYFEDIYISKKVNGEWSDPEQISENINTKGHEATIGLSADGQQLFIYKDDMGVGNIYYSMLDGDEWTKPVKLGGDINTSAHETHATITRDGNTLYFTSTREGGFGGSDIYLVHKLPNGEWSRPQNLGPKVNTPYNEEGPFIHPDGYTLIFSSQGHNSMGGYDLFTSTVSHEERICTQAVNMGYPINTPMDELFYVLSADGKRAYFSSLREDGSGGRDLYVMNLLSLPERSIVVVKGVVKRAGTDEVPKDIEISVTEVKTGKTVGTYKPNKVTGSYTIILHKGKEYKLKCEAENCRFLDKIIKIPLDTLYKEINKPIELKPLGTVTFE